MAIWILLLHVDRVGNLEVVGESTQGEPARSNAEARRGGGLDVDGGLEDGRGVEDRGRRTDPRLDGIGRAVVVQDDQGGVRLTHVDEPLLPLAPEFVEAIVGLHALRDLENTPGRRRNARSYREARHRVLTALKRLIQSGNEGDEKREQRQSDGRFEVLQR